jgi:hypothetical protein
MRRVAILLFFVFGIGCTSKSTPTPVAAPTSIASCFPASVFTADEMRARVDCHPDEYKLEINQDTVVLFAFPDPLLDWVGPVFVIHIPSVSEVVLDTNGNVLFSDYKSSDVQNAIESILNDQELMARILQRAKDIGR